MCQGTRFDFPRAMMDLRNPTEVTDWVELVGIAAFALIGGLFTAAVYAARHGEVASSDERWSDRVAASPAPPPSDPGSAPPRSV